MSSIDIEERRETLATFTRIVTGAVLAVAFTMIALVAFGFGGGWSALVALIGLAAGYVAIAVTVAAKNVSWLPSLIIALVFALVVFASL